MVLPLLRIVPRTAVAKVGVKGSEVVEAGTIESGHLRSSGTDAGAKT
jgi:hypothetical protein